MNRICFLLLIFSNIALAQEPLGKCPKGVFYNWKVETKYAESWDKKYLAIGDIDGINQYHKSKEDFINTGKIKRATGPSTDLYLSDTGNLLVLGESFTDTQSDKIEIYNKDGELIYTISGEDVLSSKELESAREKYESTDWCTPEKPWICWDEAIFQADNSLYLNDVLGRNIVININNGNVKISNEKKQCKMFL
ncbi:hypothetical protein NBRC116493_02870 [Aurantivibrio infirmus]